MEAIKINDKAGDIYQFTDICKGTMPPNVYFGRLACDDESFTRSVEEIVALCGRQETYRSHATTTLIRSVEESNNKQTSQLSEAQNGLNDGFSIQIRGLEAALSQDNLIRRCASDIQLAIKAPLDSITAFISPANARALNQHRDPTDIITIQLVGTKNWQIVKEGETQQVGLKAKDILIMPAGTEHLVESGDEISLSIAIVFRKNNPTSDLIEFASESFARSEPPVMHACDGTTNLLSKLHSLLRDNKTDIDQYIKNKRVLSVPDDRPITLRTSLSEQETFTLNRVSFGHIIELDDVIRLPLSGHRYFEAPWYLIDEINWVLNSTKPFYARDISTRLPEHDCLKLLKKMLIIGLIRREK
ncbi:TPA: cupin domain-containing protein [Vibrio diabolicus]